MRLYTYLKIYANLTKSEVNKLIEDSKVTVNDKIEPLTCNIAPTDIVKINDKIIKKYDFKYYLYYKPKGILSTIRKSQESYINQINMNNKMMVAGRLDKDSEGLMILTNDGKFINELMIPNNHEKEYIVTLKKK